MTWIFQYTDLANPGECVVPCADWQEAKTVMAGFIDMANPKKSLNSLKTECENIPIGVSRSITDGDHIFAVKSENA